MRLGARMAVVMVGLCAAGNAWAFSFSIEPSRIELSIPANKQRGRTVTINNSRSQTPLHIRVYAQDIVFLPDGTNEYAKPGSTAWSCAKWIRVIPEELDIPAGKIQDVRVSIAVPEGARGGYYAMLFFESGPSYTNQQGLAINFRIGALTQATVPGTEAFQARLAELSIDASGAVRADLFNDGNVLVRPKGKIKLLNQAGKRVAQYEFNPERLGVLPQSLRTFWTHVDPLPPGAYRLKAEIDYGSRNLLVGERPLDVR